MNQEMAEKFRSARGFIAALDQSGGSTPKALKLYGIEESEYSGDDQMFDLVHQMRTRIMKNSAFNGDRVLAAILFEGTMDRDIDGVGSAEYLWNSKNIVPVVKVDKGFADEENGAQVMKPMAELDALLSRAREKVSSNEDALGHQGQQRRWRCCRRKPAVRHRVADSRRRARSHHRAGGGHPQRHEGGDRRITPDKLAASLDSVPEGKQVVFKLSLPSQANFYAPLINHPKVMCRCSLGGYSGTRPAPCWRPTRE